MKPKVSVLVIVYDMARQAMNTLHTLSAAHQKDVSTADYEVVVVENASGANLDEGAVAEIQGQFRYVRRREPESSPAAAVNEGLALCRGRWIGLMIDGAHMVTPRVVRYALDAFAASREALVAVPGYHLGARAQQHHRSVGYDEEVERDLLASVDWQTDGYVLFEIACAGDPNPRGVFHPFLESNCMFASREAFDGIGGADERFDFPGGGSLNLYIYRALGLRPGFSLFVLPGEGTFHQFHGGVTTAHDDARRDVLAAHRRQLEMIWGAPFHSLRREPTMLGVVPEPAMRFLEWSAGCEIQRYRRSLHEGVELWPDEPDSQAGASLS